MARIRYNHNSFSIGVLSKKVQGNTEFEGYNNALDECVNFQIQQTGGLFKRGGTCFVAETKSGEAVLIPFSYSAEDQYICEFGDKYIRFFTRYGQLTKDDGSIVELQTQFTIDDIKTMKTFQDGNVLNLVTNKGIFSLTRTETDSFELSDEIAYTSEPLTFPNHERIALKPDKTSGTAKSPITITAVDPKNTDQKPNTKYAPLFFQSDVGHFLVLTYTVLNNNTGIFENKKFYLLILSVIEDMDGFKKVTAVVDSEQSDGNATALPNNEIITRWQIGAFTSDRGMPKAAAVYEGRLFLANNLSFPTGIWGSSKMYNDWTDFYTSTNDADGVSFKMNAQHADEILWLVSQSKLFAGTRWGIYIGGSATYNDEAITPSNFRLRLFESIGASELQPISALDSIFFVDVPGRNVHEIYLSSETGAYEASDLSLLSDELTRSGIVSHAWQQTPIKTYWCAVKDGFLCSLTYLKNNGILAWAKHIISGKNVKVENICTMQGDNSDLLWMVVRREIKGEFKRYIEYLHPGYDPVSQEEFEQFYVDSGISKELKYEIKSIVRGRNPRLKFNAERTYIDIINQLLTINNGLIKVRFHKDGTSNFLTSNIFLLDDVSISNLSFSASVFRENHLKIKSSDFPVSGANYYQLNGFIKIADIFEVKNNRIYCDTQFLINENKIMLSDIFYSQLLTLPGLLMNWISVCYGNKRFIAIALDGKLAYDSGAGWTGPFTLPQLYSTSEWTSICYGNGRFVAVNDSINTKQIAYSDAYGINWTMIDNTVIPFGSFSSICYGNGKFVAVTRSNVQNNNNFAYSTNGVNWSTSKISNTLTAWTSVCFGNGRFVAISYQKIAYSDDGIRWLEISIQSQETVTCITYGNGKFVILSSGTQAFYSTDGVTWESTILPLSQDWTSVCFGNGRFVAIATGTDKAVYSEDGITWRLLTLPGSESWKSICYGDRKYVAVASQTRNGLMFKDSDMDIFNVASRSADSIALTDSQGKTVYPLATGSNEIFLSVSNNISVETAPEDCKVTVDEALPVGYSGKVYINKVNGMVQLNSLTFSISDISTNRKQFTLVDDYTSSPLDASEYSPFDMVNPSGNVYLYFNVVEKLDHLAEQEVAICVDGNSISNQIVPPDGTLVLDRDCMYCSVGLPIKSWMKTTPFSGGSVVGSSVGSVGAQKSMWLHLYYSLGGKYGSEPSKVYDIPYTNFISGFNKTKNLISGLIKCPVITAHDVYDRSIYIEHEEPLSFNILSLTQDIEVSDA